MAESTITRKWCVKGSKPAVKSYAGRKAVAYSGFVIPESGELVVTKPGWFNFQTTIGSIRAFLSSYKAPEGRRICMVMDNAPWHRKAKRLILEDPCYSDIKDKVAFISMPPYSPDLNPIEQVWRITRREKTHNRYWSSIEKLETVLDEWFNGFRKPNAKLHSLCSFA